MKIEIEPTGVVVSAANPTGQVPARMWTGLTDAGVRVRLYVAAVQVDAEADQAPFAEALRAAVVNVEVGEQAPVKGARYDLSGRRLADGEHHSLCSYDTRRGCNCGLEPSGFEVKH